MAYIINPLIGSITLMGVTVYTVFNNPENILFNRGLDTFSVNNDSINSNIVVKETFKPVRENFESVKKDEIYKKSDERINIIDEKSESWIDDLISSVQNVNILKNQSNTIKFDENKLNETKPSNSHEHSNKHKESLIVENTEDDYSRCDIIIDGDESMAYSNIHRNEPTRVIAGIGKKYDKMKKFLKEESEEIEKRDWWGNLEY
jgi:hypothetical protein